MYNPFRKSYSDQDRNTFDFLRRSYLFADLSDNELAEFLPFLYSRQYKRNEVVFFRSDPSQALYIVKRGTVLLSLDIDEKFEELTRLRSPEIFGENALLESVNRVYNAVVVSEAAELWVIPTINIFEIFEDNLVIRAKMMTSLCEHYNQYVTNVFRAYKETFGFFDLSKIYAKR